MQLDRWLSLLLQPLFLVLLLFATSRCFLWVACSISVHPSSKPWLWWFRLLTVVIPTYVIVTLLLQPAEFLIRSLTDVRVRQGQAGMHHHPITHPLLESHRTFSPVLFPPLTHQQSSHPLWPILLAMRIYRPLGSPDSVAVDQQPPTVIKQQHNCLSRSRIA